MTKDKTPSEYEAYVLGVADGRRLERDACGRALQASDTELDKLKDQIDTLHELREYDRLDRKDD